MTRRWITVAAALCVATFPATAELRFDARDELSWDVEGDAISWEVARSAVDGFAGCAALPAELPSLTDTTAPPPGSLLYYLERAAAPTPGDWGTDSAGTPRQPACACSAFARTYGGAGEEILRAAVPTPDGGLAFVGSSRSFNGGAGDRDAWTVMLDAGGGILWQNRIATAGTEVGEALTVTAAGDVILGGDTLAENAIINWNLAIALLDGSTGGALGVLEVGEALEDRVRAMVATPDGGAVMVGHSRATDPFAFDLIALRFDRNGIVVRQTLIDGGGSERAYDVAPLPDGGFLIAADTTSYGAGDWDVWILDVDPELNLRRSTVLRGEQFERPGAVLPLAEGGALVVGGTESFGAVGRDAWVVRLDGDLGVVWQRRYGDAGFDEAFDARRTSDGFLVAGRTDASGTDDAWLLRLDEAGAVIDDRRYGGAGSDVATVLARNPAGGFWVAGDTDSFGAGGRDVWLLKVEDDGSIDAACDLAVEGATVGPVTDAVVMTPEPFTATPGATPMQTSVSPIATDGTSAQQCVSASCGP